MTAPGIKQKSVGGAMLALLLMGHGACAATWSEQTNLPVTLAYDTNPRMASSNYHSAWRLNSAPGVKLSAVNGLDELSADLMLRVERSTNKTEVIDREDPSASIGWMHAFEKGQLGVTGKYEEASSRASELDDTGQVQLTDGTRTTKALAVHWQWLLSEKTSLALNGDYRKLEFSGTGKTGNKTRSIIARLDYALSDRLAPYISATYARFQPDAAGSETKSITGLVGTTWLASDSLSYGAYWGLNRTSVESSGETQWQGGANAAYVGDRMIANLAYTRSSGSSGSSNSITSDYLVGKLAYDLTELDHVGMDLSWKKILGDRPAENFQLSAWFGRALTMDWSVKVSADYKWHETDSGSANAKVIGATVTYATPNF